MSHQSTLDGRCPLPVWFESDERDGHVVRDRHGVMGGAPTAFSLWTALGSHPPASPWGRVQLSDGTTGGTAWENGARTRVELWQPLVQNGWAGSVGRPAMDRSEKGPKGVQRLPGDWMGRHVSSAAICTIQHGGGRGVGSSARKERMEDGGWMGTLTWRQGC